MTYFLKDGNNFRVFDNEAIDIQDTLPVGNYIISEYAISKELYLEKVESFALPSKIYGETLKQVEKILNTYKNRSGNTGVLLSGEKGSGKSLLAKLISTNAAHECIPTLVINSPYKGDSFGKLLQNIKQDCIIIFDEFEKIYDNNEQEEILTILDGTFSSKKLFIFTCNDRWRINPQMRNRPGRIFYAIDFSGLEENFIREYCKEHLSNEKYIEEICNLTRMFNAFNFDMLKAITEEVNRYDESPLQAIKMLNIKVEEDSIAAYKVELEVEGEKIEEKELYPNTWHGSPLNSTIRIEREVGADEIIYTFVSKDLRKFDLIKGAFVFINNENEILRLTKEQTYKFNPFAF